MRSLKDISTIISNKTCKEISMRSTLKAHRGVDGPPNVLSFRSIAERYDNDGGNIIRFLSYNTYLLDGISLANIGEKPAKKDRARELGLELAKTINLGPGLEKSYEIISLYEVFSSEVQNIIARGIPQYKRTVGAKDVGGLEDPGLEGLVKGSGLYHLISPNRSIVDTK